MNGLIADKFSIHGKKLTNILPKQAKVPVIFSCHSPEVPSGDLLINSMGVSFFQPTIVQKIAKFTPFLRLTRFARLFLMPNDQNWVAKTNKTRLLGPKCLLAIQLGPPQAPQGQHRWSLWKIPPVFRARQIEFHSMVFFYKLRLRRAKMNWHDPGKAVLPNKTPATSVLWGLQRNLTRGFLLLSTPRLDPKKGGLDEPTGMGRPLRQFVMWGIL